MNSDPRSPREWLLHRHASAEPKLDALRCVVLQLAVQAGAGTASSNDITTPGALLRALFLPQRRSWAALAAVWTMLCALHFFYGQPERKTPLEPLPNAAIACFVNQLDPHETFAQIDRQP